MEPRLPPHNQDAEKAVLGSCLIDPDAIIEIDDFLKPADFYIVAHGWIYEAIQNLYRDSKPIDTLTVSEALRKQERLESVGDIMFLVDLVGQVPTSINCEAYGRIVRESSVRRSAIQAAGEIAKLAYDEESSLDEMVSGVQGTILQIGESATTNDLRSAGDFAEKYIEILEAKNSQDGQVTGISTGFFDLDAVVNGLNPSELTILAARPGMGKTALSTSIALTATLKNKAVAIFNLEMSGEQLMGRLNALHTGIPLSNLRRGELEGREWQQIYEAAKMFRDSRLAIDDTSELTPMQLRSKCQRYAAHTGIDLLIVDYVQLMQADHIKNNRVLEIGEISRGLKKISKELNIPVLALAQLNRGLESRIDKRPLLSDLRGSGDLEQDADNVWFIHRDEYYNPETTDRPNVAEIIVAKQRNGPTMSVDLHWNSHRAKFSNLETIDLNNVYNS